MGQAKARGTYEQRKAEAIASMNWQKHGPVVALLCKQAYFAVLAVSVVGVMYAQL